MRQLLDDIAKYKGLWKISFNLLKIATNSSLSPANPGTDANDLTTWIQSQLDKDDTLFDYEDLVLTGDSDHDKSTNDAPLALERVSGPKLRRSVPKSVPDIYGYDYGKHNRGEDYEKDNLDDYEEYGDYSGKDSREDYGEDNVNDDVPYDYNYLNRFGQSYGRSKESNESEEYEYYL